MYPVTRTPQKLAYCLVYSPLKSTVLSRNFQHKSASLKHTFKEGTQTKLIIKECVLVLSILLQYFLHFMYR